jgi:LDH2 family malate/lactate/ureidoglycolate dehydrogenase
MSQVMIQSEKLKLFTKKALVQAGMSTADARIIAEVLVTNDMRGVYTHGTNCLKGYVKHIQKGGMNPKPNITVLREGPAYALVDGDAGSGVLVSYKAMKIAIKKARKSGVALVSVRNSSHFAAAGYYSNMCADEGMIGIALSNSDPIMAATGSADRVIGNSPFSYAVPWNDQGNLFLDMAMSVVSGMKIVQYDKEGKKMPLGWLLDPAGNPTTDPAAFKRGAKDGGALLPFADYKGYALAVMVECLGGVLSGAALTSDIRSWTTEADQHSDEGHFFLAVDIKKFMPLDLFKQRVDTVSNRIRGSRKAPGSERIYMPGEKELDNDVKAQEAGFYPGEMVLDNLRALAEDIGMMNEFNELIKS